MVVSHNHVIINFSVLFIIVITTLGEDRAGLYVSRAFVCLSCMRSILSFSLPFGVAGLLWLVNLAFTGLSFNISHNNLQKQRYFRTVVTFKSHDIGV